MSYYHHLIKAGASYGALTTLWITARSITDIPTINAVNTFESTINPIIGKFHHMQFLFNGDATKNNYNFIGNSAFDLTYFGSITHASTGMKSTTNGFFKTGYTPLTHGTLNSAHQCIYSRNSMAFTAKCSFGSYGVNNGTSVCSPYWDGSPKFPFNQNGSWGDNSVWNGSAIDAEWTNSRGVAIGSRISSTEIIGSINGYQRPRTSLISSNIRSDREVYGLCMNFQGGQNFYSDNELTFISQGEGLTSSEIINLCPISNVFFYKY